MSPQEVYKQCQECIYVEDCPQRESKILAAFSQSGVEVRCNKEAAIIQARAIEKQGKILQSISEAEIESKDRVDIPLREYERLKMENAALRERCMHVEALFKNAFGIDPKVIEKIDASTVRKCEIQDPRELKTIIRLEFDVPYQHKNFW